MQMPFDHEQPAVAEFPLEAIRIGDRFRRELGDIALLASSIAEIGLLHPIVLTSENELIAGARRIAAFRQLGRTSVPAHVVPLADIVRGEFDENAVRSDFLPSEYVAIKRALADEERRQARQRQLATLKRGDDQPVRENSPNGVNGRSGDKIARAAGVSRRTMEKADAVVAAAEREPERFAGLVEEMDRTRRVNGVYRKLVVSEKAAVIRQETPPLPGHGPYRVIVADPPWAYDKRALDPSQLGACPYPQMGIEEICALAVVDIAHDDAILWLWTTNAHIREAFAVIDAWGFTHKTILTWAKPKMGVGDWLRGQTEHCIMSVRGKPTVQLSSQTTLLHAPAGEHSAKPDAFYALVEALCPAPRYAELFQRQPRKNWDGHGDEA
jgi:N6-adenosine-specific RNA methylase IME4/ParB-like chromosome segregation protein Spo0J